MFSFYSGFCTDHVFLHKVAQIETLDWRSFSSNIKSPQRLFIVFNKYIISIKLTENIYNKNSSLGMPTIVPGISPRVPGDLVSQGRGRRTDFHQSSTCFLFCFFFFRLKFLVHYEKKKL